MKFKDTTLEITRTYDKENDFFLYHLYLVDGNKKTSIANRVTIEQCLTIAYNFFLEDGYAEKVMSNA